LAPFLQALHQRLNGLIGIGGDASDSREPHAWPNYLRALAISSLCTAIAFPIHEHVDLINIVMIYLLGATLSGLRLGRGPAILTSVANELAFDYFFVPPAFSLEVADTRYLLTLGVMLIISLIIANLVATIKRHMQTADARERRTAMLYAMSRELAVATDAKEIAAAAVRHIYEVFGSTTIVLAADESGRLAPVAPTGECFDVEFAQAAAARGERADKDGIYLPLQGSRRNIGVIVVRPRPAARVFPVEKQRLLDSFATQIALSLERAQFAEAAEAARISAERAALRNTLLTSISHDLRTPLSAIAGAGSLIAQPTYELNADRRATLGQLIERKARDMSQLLSNVLELMRMEFAPGALHADWHAIDDLVSTALRGNEARLAQRRLVLELPADLPMIQVEATLIVQIIGNLLENAAKYTPVGTTITISAAAQPGSVTLVVADDGPGFPAGDPELLFEKFERGRTESNIVGVGLGLAICRAAVRLHGGDIRATENAGGGARFEIRLPVKTIADAAPIAEAAS
jgi:two-component system, OmpR family, sensor histidine kinase KdpD